MNKYVYLPIIMLACGMIGGVAVHITTKNKRFFDKKLIEKVLNATIASFLVPLFLSTISSNLIEKIGTDFQSIYIFIGFCLIASLSSKVFISALTNKTITSLEEKQNENSKQIKQLNNAVETLVAKNSENTIEAFGNGQKLAEEDNDNCVYMFEDQVQNKMLFEIGRNNRTFISANVLSELLNLSSTTIIRKLREMVDKNIINVTNIGSQQVYGITLNGAGVYTNLVNSIEWKIIGIKEKSIFRDFEMIYEVLVESQYGIHNLEVYAKTENLGLNIGDKIKVNTVNGVKVNTENISMIQ